MEELYFNGYTFNLNEDDTNATQDSQTGGQQPQQQGNSTGQQNQVQSYEDFKYTEDSTISRICTDIAARCKSDFSDDGVKIGQALVDIAGQIAEEQNNKIRELDVLNQKIEDAAVNTKNQAAKINMSIMSRA